MRAGRVRLGVVLLLTACATDPQGDLISVVGVVRGTVMTAAQAPVANAQVVAVATYPLSNGTTIPVADSVRTDASGRYLVTLTVGNLPDATVPAQIEVRGTPGQPAGQSAPLMIRMTATAARDTVVADVVVNP
jgi:hypothetical protein